MHDYVKSQARQEKLKVIVEVNRKGMHEYVKSQARQEKLKVIVEDFITVQIVVPINPLLNASTYNVICSSVRRKYD